MIVLTVRQIWRDAGVRGPCPGLSWRQALLDPRFALRLTTNAAAVDTSHPAPRRRRTTAVYALPPVLLLTRRESNSKTKVSEDSLRHKNAESSELTLAHGYDQWSDRDGRTLGSD
ncbi:hypothetical protein J6590_070881 [Homalodisca vitripennis]|nr:hypothetical protein J6590_070881 [Homalodisca vitripennis]